MHWIYSMFIEFIFDYWSKPWHLVNPKIAGKWMFIPLELIRIGFDPPPFVYRDYRLQEIYLILRSWDYSSCLKDGTIRMSPPQDLGVAKGSKSQTRSQHDSWLQLGSALSQLLKSIFLYLPKLWDGEVAKASRTCLEALGGRNLSLGALEHGNQPALSTENAEARSASQWSLAQAFKIQLGPIHSPSWQVQPQQVHLVNFRS